MLKLSVQSLKIRLNIISYRHPWGIHVGHEHQHIGRCTHTNHKSSRI